MRAMSSRTVRYVSPGVGGRVAPGDRIAKVAPAMRDERYVLSGVGGRVVPGDRIAKEDTA